MSASDARRWLAVASANEHKLQEIEQILGPLGFACRGLGHWPELGELAETGGTFAENALQKARALYAHSGLLSVADDSGLEVDALGGRPGVHSKRFTPEARADTNNRRLLVELAGVDDRRARFRCAVAVVGSAGEWVVEASCEGQIAKEQRGEGGFGYDPLFLPVETPGRTMAELAPHEKNHISHRGRAFRQLPGILAAPGGGNTPAR